MKVSAKIQKPAEGVSGEAVTVEYDFGNNLKESVKKFGEDVIFSRAKASLVIDLQSMIRRLINGKKSTAEIQQAVAEWMPGLKAPAKSPAERLRDMMASKTPEERDALLREAGLI